MALDAVLRRHPGWEACAVRCCHCGIRFFTHPRNQGREKLRCPFGCRKHHRRQCGNARSRKYNQTPQGRANKKKLNTAARLKAGKAASGDAAPSPAALEACGQTGAPLEADKAALSDSAPSPAALEACGQTGAPLEADKAPLSDSAPSPAALEACGQTGASLEAGKAASGDAAPPPASSLGPSSQLAPDSPSANSAEATTVDASPSVAAVREQFTLHLDGFVLNESTLVKSRVLPYLQMLVTVLEGEKISREELLTTLRTRIRQRSIGRLSRREYVLHYLNQHPP